MRTDQDVEVSGGIALIGEPGRASRLPMKSGNTSGATEWRVRRC